MSENDASKRATISAFKDRFDWRAASSTRALSSGSNLRPNGVTFPIFSVGDFLELIATLCSESAVDINHFKLLL